MMQHGLDVESGILVVVFVISDNLDFLMGQEDRNYNFTTSCGSGRRHRWRASQTSGCLYKIPSRRVRYLLGVEILFVRYFAVIYV